MTTDVPSPPLSLSNCHSAHRDLRVDLVRGLALLIIFSDHVLGNPVREYMPISLGFSDMAEVFVFVSGYLNGISRSAGVTTRRLGVVGPLEWHAPSPRRAWNRAPCDSHARRGQIKGGQIKGVRSKGSGVFE